MRQRKTPADMLADVWFQHPVWLAGEDKRTGVGIIKGDPVLVMADVSAQSRVVVDQSGADVTVAATVSWHVDGPVPEIGRTLTLPDSFGMKPDREIITVRVEQSGTGMTPDHIEVTVK